MATKFGSRAYVPEREDVVWLTFDPQAGHVKGYPFEVILPPGLPVAGAVLTDQIKSLDWRARKAEKIGALPAETVRQIIGKSALLLTGG